MRNPGHAVMARIISAAFLLFLYHYPNTVAATSISYQEAICNAGGGDNIPGITAAAPDLHAFPLFRNLVPFNGIDDTINLQAGLYRIREVDGIPSPGTDPGFSELNWIFPREILEMANQYGPAGWFLRGRESAYHFPTD